MRSHESRLLTITNCATKYPKKNLQITIRIGFIFFKLENLQGDEDVQRFVSVAPPPHDRATSPQPGREESVNEAGAQFISSAKPRV